MSNFEFGKEAALNEMIEYADAGYGLEDLVDLATETINDDQVMNKIASEEDFDFQLGVEAFCHEFMAKTASLMGEYDTSELDELDKIAFVIEKIAEDKKKGIFGRGVDAVGEGLARVGRGVAYGAASPGDGRIAKMRNAAANFANKNQKSVGAATLAAGAGTLAAGGLGARKLYKKRQAAKAQGQNKQASEIDHAVAILQEAGLLD
ncbi:MAG: hypothetical protein ACR2MS_07930 [Weeksellaceae bacterium]